MDDLIILSKDEREGAVEQSLFKRIQLIKNFTQ